MLDKSTVTLDLGPDFDLPLAQDNIAGVSLVPRPHPPPNLNFRRRIIPDSDNSDDDDEDDDDDYNSVDLGNSDGERWGGDREEGVEGVEDGEERARERETQVRTAECNAPSRRRPIRSTRNQSAMYNEDFHPPDSVIFDSPQIRTQRL